MDFRLELATTLKTQPSTKNAFVMKIGMENIVTSQLQIK